MPFSVIILFVSLTFLGAQNDADRDSLKSYSIIGVGDIMLGTDYPSPGYLPPGGDCAPLLREVCEILANADVSFGNLEGTMAGTEGEPKKCKDTTQCFVFRMPEKFAECLVNAGFDMLSVANNHSNDFGTEGRRRTQQVLDSAGLAYAGSYDTPFTVVLRDSMRYGLASFAPNTGCYSITDIPEAVAMLEMFRDHCDILIVSFHGGAEGKDHQHVTRDSELYLGSDRGNVYEFAHAAIDAGADVVFGHGPHVTRGIEIYNERFISYSLGNFCTYGRFNLNGPNGIAPIIRLEIDTRGRFLRGEVIPVYQPGNGGVRPDPQKRVIAVLRDLSNADFPDNPVRITDDGKIISD